MPPVAKWHLIDHAQTDVPSLYLAAQFDDDGYTIYLSDLTRTWTQSLDKNTIIHSAKESECPINPSEDEAQYSILLDKLRSAASQQEGTSLELLSKNNDSGRVDLTLILKADLPDPLPALRWTCNLRVLGDESARSIIVDPLITTIRKQQAQINDLVDKLIEKDQVISKMWNFFESNPGMEMNEVFPLPGGRTKSQSREILQKHFKGLKYFGGELWKKEWENREIERSQPQQITEMLSSIIRPSTSDTHHAEEWFKHISFKKIMKGSTMSDTEDDEKASDEAATTSIPKKKSPLQQNSTDSIPPKRKLGVIGGRKEALTTKSSAAGERVEVKPKAKLGTIGGKKVVAKTDGTVDVSKEVDVSNADPAVLSSSQQTKLGTIGGKIADAVDERGQGSAQSNGDEAMAVAPPLTSRRNKLGTIGGKKASPHVEESDKTSESPAASPPRQKRKLGAIGGSNADNHAKVIKQEHISQEQEDNLDSTPKVDNTAKETADGRPVKRKALIQASKKRVF